MPTTTAPPARAATNAKVKGCYDSGNNGKGYGFAANFGDSADSYDSGSKGKDFYIKGSKGFGAGMAALWNESVRIFGDGRRVARPVGVVGCGRVTVGERVLDLPPGQHVDIALGEVHRLANPGPGPLEIIEVQFGAYLGEDDIVRLQDVYGRA